MTITAKFSTVCPCCNQRINAGEKVEWKKGEKAKHVACATGPGQQYRPVVGSLYGRRSGCSCGSIEGQIRKSDCWTCRHDAE